MKLNIGFNKRGIADAQFHWLFVVIAGGFVLLLFAIFINQGIVANQNKQTALMLQYLDGVLSSSQNIQNLNDQIASSKSLTIEQKCEIGEKSRLVFVGQELDKPTTYLPIFSNYRISGAFYALKTLSYDAPFKVDNPIYLTDTSTLYVVYSSDPDIQDKYVRLLPSHAVVVATDDLSTVTESGFRNVVIITQDKYQIVPVQEGLSSRLQHSNLRHVDVITTEEPRRVDYYYGYDTKDSQGVLLLTPRDYYLDNSLQNSVEYTDDALLLGAIMSEDPALFECNKAKLDARARVIAMQIYERATELSVESNIEAQCKASYDAVKSMILNNLASNTLSDVDVQDNIRSENERLIRYSCPTIY